MATVFTPVQVRRMNARMPEVMGATEVAAELGVNQQNLNKVANLPESFQGLSRGRLWRADVIRAFAESRRNGSG